MTLSVKSELKYGPFGVMKKAMLRTAKLRDAGKLHVNFSLYAAFRSRIK